MDAPEAASKHQRGPRLYHKKSRNGCARCRARRVKCNESRPVCNNCHRHNVPCYYDRSTSPTAFEGSRQEPPLSDPGWQAPASLTELAGSSPRHDLQLFSWEFKLFHHFTVGTSHTLPGSHIPSVRDCWSLEVPPLAVDYEPLMYGVLALSSLHLISRGDRDPDLLSCRGHYLDAALRAHRQALSGLREETANAACFASILLMVDTFATLSERTIEPYEPPVSWMRIVQGVRVVFEAAWAYIKDDPTASAMTIVKTFTSSSGPSASLKQADVGPFSEILRVEPQSDGEPSRDAESDMLEAYPKALKHIRSLQIAVEKGEHPLALCRIIMSFAGLVPGRFLACVEEREPRALVIMAHFFSLSSNAQEIWWVGQSPNREAEAIRKNTPQTLLHLLDRI